MRRFFLVHGMKRSGNHGIIQWMLAQERCRFCNNIIPIAPLLKGKTPLPTPRDFETWLRGNNGSSADEESVCASLEDHRLDVRPFVELPRQTTQILIVRDPANFFASRLRKGSWIDHPAYPRGPGPLLSRVIGGWKDHAREYLGQTAVLENKVGVYFNAWFASVKYRRQLSARLGMAFRDDGFARVSPAGGGSSFEGTALDGDNQRMQVLQRTGQLDESEVRLLEDILQDDELRSLGDQIESCAATQVPSIG